MKKLGLSILFVLMSACGIDEIDKAHYETAFIFRTDDNYQYEQYQIHRKIILIIWMIYPNEKFTAHTLPQR